MLAACPVRTPTRDAPAVTVVERGVEPRRPLRYLPGPGHQVATTSRSIVDSTITTTTLDTVKQRLEFPLIRKQLTVTVANRGTGLELTQHVDEVSISADGDRDPTFRARFEVDVQKQQGTTRTTRVSATGVTTTATQDQPPPTLMIHELLTLTAQDEVVRLPDEPVGVGARWRITTHPRLQGVQWHGVETVRVTGLTADELTLATDAELIGPPQDLSVQPTQTVKLTRGRLHSTRQLTVSLRGLARTVYGESSAELDVIVWDHGLEVTSKATVKTVYTEKPVP